MNKLQVFGTCAASLVLALALSSCDSLKKMVANHNTQVEYTLTPNPLVMKGDKVAVDLNGSYAPKYFAKKAVVVMQPAIRFDSTEVLLKPLVLRGEKTKNTRGILVSNKEGGKFSYSDEVAYVDGMEVAGFYVNPVAYMEKKAKNMEITDEEEASGVPKNVRLGDRKIGPGTIITSKRIDKLGCVLSQEEHKYERETVIPHAATIYYLVDMSNLNWNIANNKKAEAKASIKGLDSLFATGMQIKSVSVAAWASPEGEESRNQKLSDNRAKTASSYFKTAYNKAIEKLARKMRVKVSTIKQKLEVELKSQGEDWDGFLAALKNSDIQEKNTVINVISSRTDKAAREQEIRNMTLIYKEIEDQILPNLRRSIINVEFLEPKRTDEQIAEYSLTHPDSLKANELLFGASLNEDLDQKLEIYRSAIRIYPDDFRAYVNASSILIARGELEEAQMLLETANASTPDMPSVKNNMGAIYLANGDFENAKSQFEAAASKEANANLGIVAIKTGGYDYAASMLADQKCLYNLALAQLLNNELAKAKETLNCIEPTTAEAQYLLAVCAAREDNVEDAKVALKAAIEINPSLKEQAKRDAEFLKFAADAEFMGIIE